jgi:hypothetical protein
MALRAAPALFRAAQLKEMLHAHPTTQTSLKLLVYEAFKSDKWRNPRLAKENTNECLLWPDVLYTKCLSSSEHLQDI